MILVGTFFLRPFAPLEGAWTFGEIFLGILGTVVLGVVTHTISITAFPEPWLYEKDKELFNHPPEGVFMSLCILIPFWEEFLFRFLTVGMLYQFGFMWAVIGSGIAFGAVHRYYKVAKMIKGGAYAWIYIMSGTIWAPIFAHALWNLLVMVFAKTLKDRQLYDI